MSSNDPTRAAAVRSRIRLAVLWLASVAVSVWAAGAMLEWATWRYDFTEPKLRESLSFRGQRFDVVYFGDSLALEGFNASEVDRQIGTHSYNFALGGGSVLESEMQLRNFLAQSSKPKLVVLGVYLDQDSRAEGVRPGLYYGLPPEMQRLFDEKMLRLEGKAVDRSFRVFNAVPAYRYRNSLDLAIKSVVSAEPQRPVFVQGQAQVMFSRTVRLGRVHDSVFDLEELRSFLTYCQSQRIAVLLVEPPNTPGWSERTRNRAAVLAAVHQMMGEYGARFVSYSETGSEFESPEWANLNHLNLAGSKKFSKTLAAVVEMSLRLDWVRRPYGPQ